MDIEHPKKPGPRDKAVAVGKAAAEIFPWMGAAVRLLDIAFPSHIQEDQERWQCEVTDRLNELARLHGLPTISWDSLAWLFALLAAKLNPDGIGDIPVAYEDWEARFSNYSASAIEEALAELLHARWIECWSDVRSQSGFGGFHATSLLFAHTHPIIHQLYPSEDAKTIASFILEQEEDQVSAMQIQEHFQWERRRAFPALAYLADEAVPADCVERHHNPDYPFIWLYLYGEARRLLRAFSRR